MELSVVIPLYNEAESLPELKDWITRVVQQEGLTYEIIFVDDGSTDTSWAVIRQMAEADPNVKGIKFRRNYGKAAGLQTGFTAAQGEVVITMDADLQDSPDEIPELVKMIREDGYDLVSGWKKIRHDPLSKTIPTKLYNASSRWLTRINLHDFNCGLKAYKRSVVKNIEVYGDMHRYIPVLAKWAGYTKIGEKIVKHRPRKYGTTKYGLSRFIYGPLDLLSIMFVGKFGKHPMHFFGSLGLFSFIIGFFILLYLSYSKIVKSEYGITERPIFYFGIMIVIIGVQLFLTGFLAEMISGNSSSRKVYQIEETVGKS